MDSNTKSWFNQGASKTSMVDQVMKRFLTVAHAADAPVAQEQQEMDPTEMAALARRRMMIGRAFALRPEASKNVTKFEDITSDVKDVLTQHTHDGFHFDLQRALGPRFMTMHQIAMGQRSQETPPSNYTFMAHFVAPSGMVLVGRMSKTGDMFARLMKDGNDSSANVTYNVQVNPKGEEATAIEGEVFKGTYTTAGTAKYMHQASAQGAGGAFEFTFSKRLTQSITAGISALYLPEQLRVVPSFALRYSSTGLSKKEERLWQTRYRIASTIVQGLSDDDYVTDQQAVHYSTALWQPKKTWTVMVAPQNPSVEIGYMQSFSPVFKLATQFSLAPSPPPQQKPNLIAKWQLGFEYSLESGTVVKSTITNATLTTTYEDKINDVIGYSVSASINYPKDAYKMGFGATMSL